MSRTATAPDGRTVPLGDVGQRVLLETRTVRVWEIGLAPGKSQPWHVHGNPYVILSVESSPGRMEFLDGSEPRLLQEYVGGAVYRAVSPAHRLQNVGDALYRNRLIEFKDLGELREAPLDIGGGARSVAGERLGARRDDGRHPVLKHQDVSVSEIQVAAGQSATLALDDVPHVIAAFQPGALVRGPAGGVTYYPGGEAVLTAAEPSSWFVVRLNYLTAPDRTSEKEGRA